MGKNILNIKNADNKNAVENILKMGMKKIGAGKKTEKKRKIQKKQKLKRKTEKHTNSNKK